MPFTENGEKQICRQKVKDLALDVLCDFRYPWSIQMVISGRLLGR